MRQPANVENWQDTTLETQNEILNSLILDQTQFWVSFNANIEMLCRQSTKLYFDYSSSLPFLPAMFSLFTCPVVKSTGKTKQYQPLAKAII